jgi:hypothetical protein
MFGKPDWFRKKTIGYRFAPTCWQGWVYLIAWLCVVAVPFITLLGSRRVPEAFVWLTVSSFALHWDWRQVTRPAARKAESEDILYIGDDDQSQVATRNYELQLRR